MVAKSFQNMEIIGEPFISNNRKYVNVKNPKTGKIRQVRWYSENEYNKMYPEESLKNHKNDRFYKSQKEILGFSKGYITIFKGDTYKELDWFRASNAKYTRWWGWYIVSEEEVPADLPIGIEPVQLPWDLVGQENEKLKPDHVVQEVIESLIYEPSASKFIGSIGERLELFVTVEKTIELEKGYGTCRMHLMRDEEDNLYVWTTSAKCWSVGTEHHIKGTVKNHKKYKNECQTILTRCIEI